MVRRRIEPLDSSPLVGRNASLGIARGRDTIGPLGPLAGPRSVGVCEYRAWKSAAQLDDSTYLPAAQNAVVSVVAANEIGKASGTFSMLRQLGGAFGVAILAAVFAGLGGFRSAQAFSNGFSPAMSVAAALSLMGAIAGLVLPGRRARTVAQTQAKAPEMRENELSGVPEQSSIL